MQENVKAVMRKDASNSGLGVSLNSSSSDTSMFNNIHSRDTNPSSSIKANLSTTLRYDDTVL